MRVSVARPDHDAQINVLGTVNLLQASLEHGTQVVFSSTGGAIYGECDGPAPEDAPRLPISPYGTSKLAAEEYLATYNRLYGTRHVSLRYGNVYGPAARPARRGWGRRDLLQHAARERDAEGVRRRRARPATTCTSATSPARPLAAAGRDGGVYNVGTGRETSVVELLDLCQRIAGTSFDATFMPPRPGEIQRSVLDPSRAVDELGWRAEHSLEDGLRETYEFFRG